MGVALFRIEYQSYGMIVSQQQNGGVSTAPGLLECLGHADAKPGDIISIDESDTYNIRDTTNAHPMLRRVVKATLLKDIPDDDPTMPATLKGFKAGDEVVLEFIPEYLGQAPNGSSAWARNLGYIA